MPWSAGRFMKELFTEGRERGKGTLTLRSRKAVSAAVLLFLSLLPLCAQTILPAQSAEQKPPVQARVESAPLMLNISKDAGESKVALDYSVRWDFSDLRGFKPGAKMLYSIFKRASSWDITENTRFRYYGLKTNPWRVFVSREKPDAAPAASAAASGNDGYRGRVKKRLRLSISPLVDNFKRDLNENVREALLSASFKHVSPELSRLKPSDRKVIVNGVLSVFDQ